MGDCCGHTSKCHGTMLLIVGAVLVANQKWFKWDIWVVIGVLLVVKGLVKMAMPVCACQSSPEVLSMKKKK